MITKKLLPESLSDEKEMFWFAHPVVEYSYSEGDITIESIKFQNHEVLYFFSARDLSQLEQDCLEQYLEEMSYQGYED